MGPVLYIYDFLQMILSKETYSFKLYILSVKNEIFKWKLIK